MWLCAFSYSLASCFSGGWLTSLPDSALLLSVFLVWLSHLIWFCLGLSQRSFFITNERNTYLQCTEGSSHSREHYLSEAKWPARPLPICLLQLNFFVQRLYCQGFWWQHLILLQGTLTPVILFYLAHNTRSQKFSKNFKSNVEWEKKKHWVTVLFTNAKRTMHPTIPSQHQRKFPRLFHTSGPANHPPNNWFSNI